MSGIASYLENVKNSMDYSWSKYISDSQQLYTTADQGILKSICTPNASAACNDTIVYTY